MTLSEKQRGVLRGMAIGALAAVLLIVLGVVLNPFGYRPDVTISERLSIALKASAFLCLFLAVSVGRLAQHRFFTPEDIDGGGLTMGSDRAKLLQSILQNTLEQSVLAVFVYLSWAILMPWSWLSVIPLAAIAFGVGRILFFSGYRHGAPSRAVGFTLAFYPSLGMLACILVSIVMGT
jgi:MAPEG family